MASLHGAWKEGALRRRQFVLALTLVWLGLGALLATAGASAGPLFLDRVLPDAGASNEMLDYLSAVDRRFQLLTLGGKQLLWTAHQGRSGNPFTGISAFPSIHVSVAALYVLVFLGENRLWAGIATVYTCVIVLGSVHLGWHYAIDVNAG